MVARHIRRLKILLAATKSTEMIRMFYLIFMIIMLVVSVAMYASMPRPKGLSPQSLTDSGVPTAEDGRDMCIVFGEGWIDDNNVINYGGLYTTAIKASGGK